MKSAQLQPDFRTLAEFRYQIRRFLHFSDVAAERVGIEPQQHQLLLALKGLPRGTPPTIGALAERLQLRHHSTVELVDRLVERGFLIRLRATDDRRRVLIRPTRAGEECLAGLASFHLQELRSAGPEFVALLQSLAQNAAGPRSSPGIKNGK
jgi:DNA-binding MarR family transcriptional regulator